MDVFDLLPSEVAPAIDKHAYDFLREQGFDVDGAASSVKKQRATRKAMRRKSQTLGIKWNGYEDSRKRGMNEVYDMVRKCLKEARKADKEADI